MMKYCYYKILPFIENEKGVQFWQVLLKKCCHFDFLNMYILGNHKGVSIYIKVPIKNKKYFADIFYGLFPNSSLKLLGKVLECDRLKSNIQKKIYKFKFSKDSIVSDVSFFSEGGKYVDPIVEILSLFNNVDDKIKVCIKYEIKFLETTFEKIKKIFVKSREYNGENMNIENKINEKQNFKEDIYGNMSFKFKIKLKIYNPNLGNKANFDIRKNIINFLKSFLLKGKLKITNFDYYHKLHINQIANFFHLPTKEEFIRGLEYNNYKKLPYPGNLPISGKNNLFGNITIFGKTDYREDKIEFGIKNEDKFRHIYIVGKTGTGKSTFLSNLIKSDIQKGNGLCLLDPHGDLVNVCIEHIPKDRVKDVILFDISDEDFPIGLNLLKYENENEKNRIVSSVVGVFYKLFEHSRGPRLEYIFRNVLLSLINYPNVTLIHIMRILTDKKFKEDVLVFVKDPILIKFWKEEFDKRTEKQKQENIGPITNKIGQFLSSSIVRNIFGQSKGKLDFKKIMDNGKILLINLSKGKIGEDNASMIGSLIVSKIQIGIMSRADLSISQRKDFFLYIDEFQNFTTSSFESILSEARKYHLSLIIANQYIKQLKDEVKNAIFGNIGTTITFTLGNDDATTVSSQYNNIVSVNDLSSLPKFTAYTRMMIDGQTSTPFSFKTLPLEEGNSENFRDIIIENTRKDYSVSKKDLEYDIFKWYEIKSFKKEKVKDKIDNIKIIKKLQVEDIILGNSYKGFVKLKFNYGLFVSVGGVEGLLHKEYIIRESGTKNWKNLYEIGDEINVIANTIEQKDGKNIISWIKN